MLVNTFSRTKLPPTFDPIFWNSPEHMESSCYPYVLGTPANHGIILGEALLPGHIAGIRDSPKKENIFKLVSEDLNTLNWKYRIIPEHRQKFPDEYVFGVLLWGKERFHFIRQDSDGLWSSKPGIGIPITRISEPYSSIMEFERNDHFFYNILGYFAICPNTN